MSRGTFCFYCESGPSKVYPVRYVALPEISMVLYATMSNIDTTRIFRNMPTLLRVALQAWPPPCHLPSNLHWSSRAR